MLSLPHQGREVTPWLHQPVVNQGITLAFFLAPEVLSISPPGVAHPHTQKWLPFWGWSSSLPCIQSRHSPSKGFGEWAEDMSSSGHGAGRGFEGTSCLPSPQLSAYALHSPLLSFPWPFLVPFGLFTFCTYCLHDCLTHHGGYSTREEIRFSCWPLTSQNLEQCLAQSRCSVNKSWRTFCNDGDVLYLCGPT